MREGKRERESDLTRSKCERGERVSAREDFLLFFFLRERVEHGDERVGECVCVSKSDTESKREKE